MKALIILILLACSAPVYADDWTDWSWSTQDVVLEVASAGITVIDWGQTRDIRNHDGMIELNPVLGRHPSKAAVNTYFGTVLAVHPIISALLPRALRTGWQYVYLGVEATATMSNYKGGLRLSF